MKQSFRGLPLRSRHWLAIAVAISAPNEWVFSQDTSPKPAVSRSLAAERSLSSALVEHVSLQFNGVPLEQVVRTLREKHGLTVNVDRGGQAANINMKQSVTCDLVGLRLQSALDRMLSGLELDWIVTGDGLLITTPARAASLLEIRIYNIADLSLGNVGGLPGGGYYPPQASAAYNTYKPPAGKVVQLGTPDRTVPDPDDGPPPFNRPPTPPNSPPFDSHPGGAQPPAQLTQPGNRQFAGISMIEIIEASVTANWKSTPAGQPIRLLNDQPHLLVIRQPQRVHREIETLLSRLRTEIKQPAGQSSDELVTIAYPIGRHENWLTQLLQAAAMSQPGNVTIDAQKLAGAKPNESELTGDKLGEALVDLVRPESWKKNGGRGDLRGLPGVLLVRQTADVHALVQQSLSPLSSVGGVLHSCPACPVPFSAGRVGE